MENLKNKIWVVYGKGDSYEEGWFNLKPRNKRWENNINKPSTGLWASPLDSAFGWSDFLKCDSWNLETLSQHFLFRLTQDANIYVVDDLSKLIDISTNKPIHSFIEKNSMNIDFLMDNYDGVYITEEMTSRYHLDYSIPVHDLNAWDCESICIWNKNVIEPIKEEEIEKIIFNIKNHNFYKEKEDYTADTEKETQERYRNRNVDLKQPFSVHPAILSQGDENDKMTNMARKYNGTIDSVIESKIKELVKESMMRILRNKHYHK